MSARKSGGNSHRNHGRKDDDGCIGVDHDQLGIDMRLDAFIRQVDAIIEHPRPHAIVAGRNADTSADSDLFWTYGPAKGLHVEARPGFLTTGTGNGGFSLDVERDGSWTLTFSGSRTVISHRAGDDDPPASPPPPPDGNETVLLPAGPSVYDASRGNVTVDGGTGWDTVQGGVGDYIIGGSGTLGGGQDGQGNCALYSASPGSILVDAEHGRGYGGNAEGNVLINVNQVRGSLFSNVLIGAHTGTDLKSGGDDTLMISTGGHGFEMRPDGSGNVLVSTVGDDWVLFDPTHGWNLGDDNIMLGFDGAPGHDFLDLRMLTATGGVLGSNFHQASAVGYDPLTGHGDINAYVRVVDQADGSHVLFDASGNVQAGGTEILSLKFVHGVDAQTLFDNGAILA
jgi:hypothetical protein